MSDERAGDSVLVGRARRGDLEAFDVLVRRHQARALSLAVGLLGDAEAAADAAQEAFLAAWRALPRFRGQSAFSTWIYRITYNTCLDFSSRRRRRREVLEADRADEEREPAEPHDSAPTPDEAAERDELRETVRAALAQLPPPQRMIITLFDIEGLSYEEIRDVLHAPIGTVKSRLNRARLALRRVLAPMLAEHQGAPGGPTVVADPVLGEGRSR
jgi:RNA polymerase sigma-70 factor (ECF subfamily)